MRIAASFLAALILLGTAACKKQPSPTVFIDPALAPLVPRDTVMLAGVRMGQLQQTPFYTKYVTGRSMEFFESVRKRTGLDPARIWELMVANNGSESVLLIRGKFSDTGLEPRIQLEGAERLSYKSYILHGDEKHAMTFLNPSTAMAGSTPMLRHIIDNRNQGSGIPVELQKRIGAIPSTNQIWFAANVGGRVPDVKSSEGMWANMGQLAKAVQFLSGGIDVRSGFRMKAKIEASSDTDARRLHDAVRALVGFARLRTPEDRRELLRLYDGITVVHEGREARVDVEAAPDLVDEVVRFASGFTGREGREAR